jgi:hypothetical protein
MPNMKYDKQGEDKQGEEGKAAFKERNPHTTKQQEPAVRSPGGHQTKTGQEFKENK